MNQYIENGEIKTKPVTQGIAYTTDGFLLPCCWCDSLSTRKDIENLGFYNEKLKLSNNDSVEDILNSTTFINFIEIIINRPKEAPRCCKDKCGVL
jgi:hypothetical protein